MGIHIKWKTIGMAVIVGVMCVSVFSSALAANVPRMTPDTLKGLLGNPGVMILDVRSGSDWDSADSKIQGSERALPGDIEKWAENYPKGITLVLY